MTQEPKGNMDKETEVEFSARLAAIEERLRSLDKATELQAAEYSRRLSELNHAHEQVYAAHQEAIRDRSEFVTRSLWDAKHGELANELRAIRREEDLHRGQYRGWILAMGLIASFIGFITSLAMHVLPALKGP